MISAERRNAKACYTAAVFSGALLVAAGQISSVPGCFRSGVPEDIVVEDAAGVAQLAQTVNCSGGSFEVSWVGNVTLEQTIHVPAGTTLNITGSSDGTSAADGTGQTSLFSLDDGGVLHLSDLTLANGRAASGSAGGAILAADATVVLTRCTLTDNAADFGGAIVMARSELVAADVSFERNSALLDGGALYVDQARVSLRDCTFSGNSAEYGGGLISHGSSLGLEGVRFEGNSALLNGGAINAAEGTLVTLEGLVSFVENDAGLDSSDSFGWYGGAGWFLRDSDVAAAGRVEFVGNSAGFGSAAAVDNSSVSLSGHLWIANNSASGDGAFYVANSNMTVDGSATVQENTAKYNGAGMTLLSSTVLMSNETVFVGNTAEASGGAIAMEGSDLFFFGPTHFSNNFAVVEGGAVVVLADSFLSFFAPTVFESNSARDGGALHGFLCTVGVSDGAVWRNNQARGAGGGVRMVSSEMSLLGESELTSNAAGNDGGAMQLVSVEFLLLEDVRFASNSAGGSGGAMSMMSVGAAPNLAEGNERVGPASVDNCRFESNQAQDLGGAVHTMGGYAYFFDSDFFNNTAGQSGGALLASGEVLIESCNLTGNQAASGPAVSNTVTVTLNSTELTGNTLLCEGDGFFLDWKEASAYETACEGCLECPDCTISNPDRAQLCEPALEFTTSRAADGTLLSLELDPGFWRSSSTSKDIRECYHAPACVGGSTDYCSTGYEGPFCAVCADGYTSGIGYSCSKCTSGRRAATIAVISVLLLAVVLIAAAFGVRQLRSGSARASAGGGGATAASGGLARAGSRLKRSGVAQTVKIIVVSWQIITQFTAVTSVTYPSLYESFLSYIDVVNLDLAWMMSAGCLVATDFYVSLLVSTIGPLVVAGLVVASRTVLRRRCPSHHQDARSKIDRRHASVLFWVSFLVYSTTSSVIFMTFGCDDLDTGKSYLRVDHSVQCYNAKHTGFMWYAGIMVIVYPIGIPFCYAAVLYRARSVIKSGQEAITGSAVVLRELWEPYQKHAYFYEVVECLRRVVLSGAIVFILPNTAGQIATSFLLSLFFFVVYMVLNPYRYRSDTWLGTIGHAVVLLSIFTGLLEKVDIDDESFSQDAFAVVLLVAHCGMVLFVVMESLGVSLMVVRELHNPPSGSGRVGGVMSRKSSLGSNP